MRIFFFHEDFFSVLNDRVLFVKWSEVNRPTSDEILKFLKE